MKIKVCIGSSCHLKGSRDVVEQMKELIQKNNLREKIELSGAFCMGKCQQGVCVTVGETVHSVTPETVNTFFDKVVSPQAM